MKEFLKKIPAFPVMLAVLSLIALFSYLPNKNRPVPRTAESTTVSSGFSKQVESDTASPASGFAGALPTDEEIKQN